MMKDEIFRGSRKGDCGELDSRWYLTRLGLILRLVFFVYWLDG